jgi:hypothetical protein
MFSLKSLLPTTRSIIASTSRRVSRLMVTAVTCGCPIHGGSNSGRNAFYPVIGQMERAAGFLHDDTPQAKLNKLDAVVMSNNTGRVTIWATARPNTSKLVGSTQCASSMIISTDFWRANRASRDVSASSVLRRRCSAVSSNAG